MTAKSCRYALCMTIRKLALGLFLLLSATSAMALDCVEKSSGIADPAPIPVDTLAIPANVPSGTKVWESNPIHVTAYCNNVLHGSDVVHFYFNPKNASLGEGLKMGVSYNGQDLEANSQRLSTGSKAISKGQSVTVDVDFRLYIKVTGKPPSSGYYTGNDQFTVFQLDGSGGINYTQGAKNLKYTLSNLRSVRFIACGADLTVDPSDQEVNFGTLMQRDLLKGRKYQRPFSITATKQGCSDLFSLKAQFGTSNALLDENSINLGNGLQLKLLGEDQSPVTFNKYIPFASLNNTAQTTRSYMAEISPISGKDVSLGAFSATTIIKITYY
ncbi:large exoprotein [Zymobacter palmae]|uniref:Large exoprotein n=2 Tax=Zymobacter palmae TaxID=33074 RepID=A0A348HGN8_9GAMM|nr:fimbrial protein [Zymobacter palmae]BBG30790.1 large exoprotein [Zymobacter palmae]